MHPQNAKSPISVTESGISMLVSPVQSLNAQSPISVTESGISMLVSPVQPENLYMVVYQIDAPIKVEKCRRCF